MISTVINTEWTCVTGLQNWTLWCSDTSSPFSPPDSRAQSWQRGSRVTATCCPSADASNIHTLKTRAPEGWREKPSVSKHSLFLCHSLDVAPRGQNLPTSSHPSVSDCLYSIACCLAPRWSTRGSASEDTVLLQPETSWTYCSVGQITFVLMCKTLEYIVQKDDVNYCFVVLLLLYCGN